MNHSCFGVFLYVRSKNANKVFHEYDLFAKLYPELYRCLLTGLFYLNLFEAFPS